MPGNSMVDQMYVQFQKPVGSENHTFRSSSCTAAA